MQFNRITVKIDSCRAIEINRVENTFLDIISHTFNSFMKTLRIIEIFIHNFKEGEEKRKKKKGKNVTATLRVDDIKGINGAGLEIRISDYSSMCVRTACIVETHAWHMLSQRIVFLRCIFNIRTNFIPARRRHSSCRARMYLQVF